MEHLNLHLLAMDLNDSIQLIAGIEKRMHLFVPASNLMMNADFMFRLSCVIHNNMVHKQYTHTAIELLRIEY